ncbi:hypothetical protein N7474_000168 [Penicillium riverlandense]|uniref:uncharacterized protein n=1 Tax=Penicillium riverlandense TaxID=1903569 RepID=UPI0025499C65|nr:uncharacterized protein N7474_000168 [Penicillium riverlandense]KAJ5831857.1 hypothetical protein N7474_000168 [Penicillium riverlandense]
MEALRTAPDTSSFVPLAEHQSRTPSSFHSGPPVLHYHSQRCKVVILERDLLATPALNALRGESAAASANGSAQEDHDEGEGKDIAIEGVDAWVSSEKFLLFSPSASTGVSIPYPSISLHAIQRLRVPGAEDTEVQGLYMQIATPDAAPSDEDEEQCITLTVVPPSEPSTVGGSNATAEPTPPTASERTTPDISDAPTETPTQMLYAAVSACSNLHPDPVEPGDEDEDKYLTEEEHGNALFQAGLMATRTTDGGLPPPVDGSSGWITAENMHEFFDEEGNWIAGGEPPSLPLGPGAGTVRAREEGDEEEQMEEDDETKWQRTD